MNQPIEGSKEHADAPAPPSHRDQVVATLARGLGFPCAVSRNSDRLDFKEVGVLSLIEALEQAYDLGAGTRAEAPPSKAPADHLQEAQEAVEQVALALQQALPDASAVAALAVLGLISDARILDRRLTALRVALRHDLIGAAR